jgi:hypothetical protein
MEGSPSNTREERRLVEEEEGFETQYLFASLRMQHNPPASVSHVPHTGGLCQHICSEKHLPFVKKKAECSLTAIPLKTKFKTKKSCCCHFDFCATYDRTCTDSDIVRVPVMNYTLCCKNPVVGQSFMYRQCCQDYTA